MAALIGLHIGGTVHGMVIPVFIAHGTIHIMHAPAGVMVLVDTMAVIMVTVAITVDSTMDIMQA
jgi:hypothetical protein